MHVILNSIFITIIVLSAIGILVLKNEQRFLDEIGKELKKWNVDFECGKFTSIEESERKLIEIIEKSNNRWLNKLEKKFKGVK